MLLTADGDRVERGNSYVIGSHSLRLAAAGALIFSVQAHAQTDTACELHVWPATMPMNLYLGFGHGGIIDGSTKGREGYPAAPDNPLSAERQAQLLSEAGLPDLLKLPGYRVTLHPQPLDSRTIRTTRGRIAESTAPCYAELIVDDLILNQNTISGSNGLRGSFRFRTFGTAPEPSRAFGTWTLVKLTAFPPKPGDAPDKGVAELVQAFRTSLVQFAEAVNKPPRTKR